MEKNEKRFVLPIILNSILVVCISQLIAGNLFFIIRPLSELYITLGYIIEYCSYLVLFVSLVLIGIIANRIGKKLYNYKLNRFSVILAKSIFILLALTITVVVDIVTLNIDYGIIFWFVLAKVLSIVAFTSILTDFEKMLIDYNEQKTKIVDRRQRILDIKPWFIVSLVIVVTFIIGAIIILTTTKNPQLVRDEFEIYHFVIAIINGFTGIIVTILMKQKWIINYPKKFPLTVNV